MSLAFFIWNTCPSEIDMDEKGVRSALRLSPHYYNTPDEIDAAVAALAELLS